MGPSGKGFDIYSGEMGSHSISRSSSVDVTWSLLICNKADFLDTIVV